MLEKLFHLKKNNTTVRVELIAALTTFFASSYVLAINPQVLSDAGMSYSAVFTATGLVTAIATVIMALYANKPFLVAPSITLNIFFTYMIVKGIELSWEVALAAIFFEGLLFFSLSITRLRSWFAEALPNNFKHALVSGIGLFLVFSGLSRLGITLSPFQNLSIVITPALLLGIFGFVVTAMMISRKMRGALLLGIILTTIVGIAAGVSPPPSAIFDMPPSIEPVAFKLDIPGLMYGGLLSVVLAFFMVDFFDSLGTSTALLIRGGYVEKDGRIKDINKVMVADSLGVITGSLLGSSTLVTYAESAAGVQVGGRTGLTAIFIALFFLLALFLFPLIKAIPIAATAAAIMIVGFLMFESIRHIEFDDQSDAIPALSMVVLIPLTASISTGIGAGAIFYVLLKLLLGKVREVHPAMYITALLFFLDFVGVF